MAREMTGVEESDTINAQMTESFFYVLNDDKQRARARIAELERLIEELGPAFHEAFTQTSETWHDNAPYEAVRDHQAVLAAEMHHLNVVLRKAAISVPKAKKGRVGIGSKVQLVDGAGAQRRFLMAGDWTIAPGEARDGYTIVTKNAPLGKALFESRVGDTVALPPKSTPFRIESIE